MTKSTFTAVVIIAIAAAILAVLVSLIENNREATMFESVKDHGYKNTEIITSTSRGRDAREFYVKAINADGESVRLLVVLGGFSSDPTVVEVKND